MKNTFLILVVILTVIALTYSLRSYTIEDNMMRNEVAGTREVNIENPDQITDTNTRNGADILAVQNNETTMTNNNEMKKEESTKIDWKNYVKPSKSELKQTMDPLAYKVTQEDGTERAGTSPYDKTWDRGIYVDILSGEPLYSSRDKFDSGTGWPSFVAPISETALTLHEDRKLFSTRTETRSAIADNHIGHVFNDGPKDRGGLRYCMNGAALKFIPETEMEKLGYGEWLASL